MNEFTTAGTAQPVDKFCEENNTEHKTRVVCDNRSTPHCHCCGVIINNAEYCPYCGADQNHT